MAKLNKMEITAIAEDIISKIKVNKNPVSFKEWKKEYYETSEAKYIEGLIKQFGILNKQLGEYQYESNWGSVSIMSATYNGSLEAVALHNYNKKYPKKELPSTNDIIRELIISQARNEDVDAIIEKMIAKYSK